MNQKLISHEVPLALIEDHQDEISDYMYVLLHKMIEDQAYANAAHVYKKKGGMVYLDNSCFELGASLDNELLYAYSDALNPDVLILPDVLGDKNQTIARTFEFLDLYPHTGNFGMAVIQGANPDEMIDCYAEFRDYRCENELDLYMIGIPFVYSWVEKTPAAQAQARVELLELMDKRRVIDRSRKHHLLGTWQAWEFSHYRNYDWVYSLDTSNPIMAAIDGVAYTEGVGVEAKPKANFDSSYHLKPSDIDMDLLYNNVQSFRRIVNG